MESRNSKLLHSSPMEDDRISILPEELLCHILSFLPTKQSVATSVLSKKWKPLWRSVTTLHFDDAKYLTVRKEKEVYAPFVESVYRVMFSREIHQSIKKFRLRCISTHFYVPINVSIWVNSAVKRRVHHLDICLGIHLLRESLTNLSSIFTCTILVVLKLRGTELEPISSVDLPFLKHLHLQDLRFSNVHVSSCFFLDVQFLGTLKQQIPYEARHLCNQLLWCFGIEQSIPEGKSYGCAVIVSSDLRRVLGVVKSFRLFGTFMKGIQK